jgi:transcriptional regulator with XRE-family HTH domain
VSTKNITDAEIFSERLKTLRKGRRKAEFAAFLNTSPQNYGRYECGRIPDAVTLSGIAERCGVSVDWLLGRADSNTQCVAYLDSGRSDSNTQCVAYLDAGQPDAPRIRGDRLRIGSIETREIVEYRAVSREWLEAEVAAMSELLPTAPEGRGRLHLIRRMLEMLFELQERCADVIKGHKRPLPTNNEGKEGGGDGQ